MRAPSGGTFSGMPTSAGPVTVQSPSPGGGHAASRAARRGVLGSGSSRSRVAAARWARLAARSRRPAYLPAPVSSDAGARAARILDASPTPRPARPSRGSRSPRATARAGAQQVDELGALRGEEASGESAVGFGSRWCTDFVAGCRAGFEHGRSRATPSPRRERLSSGRAGRTCKLCRLSEKISDVSRRRYRFQVRSTPSNRSPFAGAPAMLEVFMNVPRRSAAPKPWLLCCLGSRRRSPCTSARAARCTRRRPTAIAPGRRSGRARRTEDVPQRPLRLPRPSPTRAARGSAPDRPRP